MPPSPIRAVISYGPMRLPEPMAMYGRFYMAWAPGADRGRVRRARPNRNTNRAPRTQKRERRDCEGIRPHRDSARCARAQRNRLTWGFVPIRIERERDAMRLKLGVGR